MKLRKIFDEHGFYVSKNFAKGVCFEVRKNGELLRLTYESEFDDTPHRQRVVLYKEMFDYDYKKIPDSRFLFNSKPRIIGYCFKCECMREMNNINNYEDGDLIRIEGRCEEHDNVVIKMFGKKEYISLFDISNKTKRSNKNGKRTE